MYPENESGKTHEEKTAALPPGGTDAQAGSGYKTASGLILDFHSSEFNRRDDLDDSGGNYRNFQPLDGVVTADMRHQMERQLRAVDAAIPDTATVLPLAPSENPAEDLSGLPPVTLVSRGRILIVDTDIQRAIICSRHLSDQGLTCRIALTGNNPHPASLDRTPFLEARDIKVAGNFGNFSVMAFDREEWKPLVGPSGETSVFDLVLDLQPVLSFTGYLLPPGYFASGPHPDHLDEILTELSQMRGEFQKPQFTVFQKSLCLHGRSRENNCRQCLSVCPQAAIQSVQGELSFNHALCQGCGSCAMVCPMDAVRLVYPSLPERLDSLRRALRGHSGLPPAETLVISDAENAGPTGQPEEAAAGDCRHFFVDQPGCIGVEMMLMALLDGAARVVVSCDSRNHPAVTEAIRRQVEIGRAILRGLGQPEDRIRMATALPGNYQPREAPTAPDDDENRMEIFRDEFSEQNDRRTLTRLAVQELSRRTPVQEPALPLPADAPFGTVAIGPGCTLCMACVNACPSRALIAGVATPRLALIESRCHQCHLCVEVCPEKAIHLEPRLLCDAQVSESPTVLYDAEAVRCIACGEPFATRTMINRMRAGLAGHWMYENERQLRRLQMCRTCRTQDALMSEDVKAWNQFQVR